MVDELPSRVAVLEQIARSTEAALKDIREELRGFRGETREEIRGIREEMRGIREETRGETRGIRDEMREMRKDMRSDFRWLLATFGAGFVLLLGVVAHGFGWI